jgi:hypothetical protein
MPKKSKGKKKSGDTRSVVNISGALQRMGLPVPRLPFLIGSATSLKARQAIYPLMVKLDFPIIPQNVGIAAGGCTTVLPITSALIGQFSGGLANVFAQYCIVGFRLELRVNAVTNPQGVLIVYVDEKSAGAPVSSSALAFPHLDMLVSQTESPTRHMLEWKPADLLDLDWTSTSVSVTPAWVKFFSSAAATFTAAGTVAQILVTGAISLAFQGYV